MRTGHGHRQAGESSSRDVRHRQGRRSYVPKGALYDAADNLHRPYDPGKVEETIAAAAPALDDNAKLGRFRLEGVKKNGALPRGAIPKEGGVAPGCRPMAAGRSGIETMPVDPVGWARDREGYV